MRLPKPKDYPKTLSIRGENYKIKFVVKIKGESKEVVGICYPDTRTILILKNLSAKQHLRCFIHEVLHALEFEYDLKIKHSLVYRLEKAITKLLLNNF